MAQGDYSVPGMYRDRLDVEKDSPGSYRNYKQLIPARLFGWYYLSGWNEEHLCPLPQLLLVSRGPGGPARWGPFSLWRYPPAS